MAGHVSRRQVLAGAAVAGGVAATGLPATAAAESRSDAAAAGRIAVGPTGTTVVEFRGRISQTGGSGEQFVSFGYLTRVTHARRGDLFDGHPSSETTALLTVYATGDLSARTLDQSVHALDIVGAMTVYQRKQPGASFDHPSSFKEGTAVARFDVRLQDVLTVFATGKGLPTLDGDMRQTRAGRLGDGLAGRRFGRVGERLRMFATGLGTLTDPAKPNSELEIAGNWSVE
ncbi:MAG: twin-arginine translocation signal domain-containing protein [Nocardioidaceae bacterium]